MCGFLLLAASPVVLRAEPTGNKGEELRVLTYNIHMWEPGVEALAAVIRAADADIVGLNEAWNGARNEELAQELGYHIVYGGEQSEPKPRRPHWINDHYMPQVLLTKHRIVSARFFNAMAAKEQPGNPDLDPKVPVYRGGVLAELETAQGNRVVVFVLHLHPWGGADNEKMTTMRLREIEGIVGTLKPCEDKPLLIMGDFNTRSHLDGQKLWKVTPFLHQQGFADLFRTVHPDPARHPGLTCGEGRIDYIFYNQHVTPVACRVVDEGVFGSKGYDHSDHLAVFGVVRLAGP
jgi:endonuclease/exonuclease/phosphatase family metal-dependent hydrolase